MLEGRNDRADSGIVRDLVASQRNVEIGAEEDRLRRSADDAQLHQGFRMSST
jgi:hypothetical protein